MVAQNAEWPLPIVDLTPWLRDPTSPEAQDACRQVADALHQYSALAIRDPRVSEEHNTRFLDMMEAYFAQPTDVKTQDARPEFGFQVGSTPENTEVPRCGADASCLARVAAFPDADKPLPFDAPDPKWRFFWTIGERTSVKHQQITPAPIVPAAFSQWREVMDGWGNLLLAAVEQVADMAAVGFGMSSATAFTDLMRGGPHLLAPTGSDLDRYGALGTVLAGFHYDLNFLTIHGKSRYPGLFVWPRGGRKTLVKIPDGCLLVQAGAQMEYLTGGHVQAGFHEVAVVPETRAAIERRSRERPGQPQWRVSSTLFSHIRSDNVLQPLSPFSATADKAALSRYPPIEAGTQVARELNAINLL